ncbi:MAG: alanine racemase [Kiritimatiellae bacterium]|nr:alanine racemase [Kiritimatiellia bacterium]
MDPSWVEIDAAALRDNLRAIRTALPERTEVILVVKADAYGHSAREVARLATEGGVRWLAVAHAAELKEVRAAAPRARLLVLGPILPHQTAEVLRRGATPIVAGLEHGRALAAEARRRRKRLTVHLKIDTGMGRIGFGWASATEEIRPLFGERGLFIEGICTHLARVEAGEGDPAAAQLQRFREIVMAAESFAGRKLFQHVSSSRAALLHPEWDFDAIRPGLIAYGYGAADPTGRIVTRPVLQWKCRVVHVRRVPAGTPVGYYGTYVTPAATTLAVVSAGYADGYLRALSNRAHVLIGGRRCRVVGRVSMNWITVDAGLYANVRPGDEVVLIGRQGNQEIWADELATLARTIPYEILVGIRATIPRRVI